MSKLRKLSVVAVVVPLILVGCASQTRVIHSDGQAYKVATGK